MGPNTATIRAYIKGMDKTHSEWDISAIDAPVLGLPPYASGKTMVFKPRGPAVAKKMK